MHPPTAILRAAQQQGRLTVDSLRAAMIDADCEQTSRGHVANLLTGRATWTAYDLGIALAHVDGPDGRGLIDTLATMRGAVVTWPDARDEGHLLAEVVHLTRDAASLADRVVDAHDPRSSGGATVDSVERQRIVTHAEAVLGRLAGVLRLARRGAA